MKNFFIQTKILLLVFLCLLSTNAHAQTNFSNLTILVSSCDKYSPLWDPFFTLLFKQWPSLQTNNQSIPIYLVSNSKIYPEQRVQTITIPNEKSWSDNMLLALDKIDTKYVLLALDDYWITEPVDEQRLMEAYTIMQKENLVMVQLAYNNPSFHLGENHPTLSDAIYTNKFARYKASLQMAIWDKEALKCLLRPGENPWQFELAGTARSHGYPGVFLNLDKNYPIKYLNASRQGHIEQNALDFALMNGLRFDRGNLPVVDKFNYQITYDAWKKRAEKFWDFLRNPGGYYKADQAL